MRDIMRRLPFLLLCVSLRAQSAGLKMTVEDEAGAVVADAVVSLHADAAASVAKPGATAIMDQRGLKFVPRVLPVEVGTAVEFPNSDQVRHHVYSFSPAKKFELRLYKAKPAVPVVFDQAGVAVLGCNIHDWMLGYVVVLDTPYFAKSDDTGQLAIEGIPPGDYRLDVWHARQRDAAKVFSERVHIDAAGTTHRVRLALNPPEPDPAPPSELEQKFRKYQKAADGS